MLDLWLKLAYSNLWLALSAGGQVYVCARMLGAAPSAKAMLLATLSMFWVYTFAKAVHFDPRADQANDPERTAFLKAHRIPLIACGMAGLLYGCWASWRDGAAMLGLFLAPTAIGLLYDLKILPAGFRYRRLKEVPGLKGGSVAFAWTLLTLGLSAGYGALAGPQAWAPAILWNFLIWYVNTTYFDLGDIKGDRLEGTQTLPVLLGYGRTRALLHLLNGIALLSLLWGLHQGHFGPVAWRLLPLHAIQAMLLHRARNEDTDLSIECDLIADGIFIIAALLLAFGAF
jgi:4-hydroxybenzoate polyprenyltransferase